MKVGTCPHSPTFQLWKTLASTCVQNVALQPQTNGLSRMPTGPIWPPDCQYHVRSLADRAFDSFQTIKKVPPDKDQAMKTTLLCILCLLCATAAFAQSAPVMNSNPQPVVIVDHPQHASQHAMAQETSLFDRSRLQLRQGRGAALRAGLDRVRNSTR